MPAIQRLALKSVWEIMETVIVACGRFVASGYRRLPPPDGGRKPSAFRLRAQVDQCPRIPPGRKGFPQRPEPPLHHRFPHLGHQVLEVPDVVDGAGRRSQDLAAAVEVPQVGAAGTRAGEAGAPRIERSEVSLLGPV